MRPQPFVHFASSKTTECSGVLQSANPWPRRYSGDSFGRTPTLLCGVTGIQVQAQ